MGSTTDKDDANEIPKKDSYDTAIADEILSKDGEKFGVDAKDSVKDVKDNASEAPDKDSHDTAIADEILSKDGDKFGVDAKDSVKDVKEDASKIPNKDDYDTAISDEISSKGKDENLAKDKGNSALPPIDYPADGKGGPGDGPEKGSLWFKNVFDH